MSNTLKKRKQQTNKVALLEEIPALGPLAATSGHRSTTKRGNRHRMHQIWPGEAGALLPSTGSRNTYI